MCLTATTVSAWFWISSVDLLLCVPDCYYSVFLALDLLGGPPLVCACLLLQCLPGSGSPRWTSSCVCLIATTMSAWFLISSVDLLLCVPDCYYSVYLVLDLLGGPPLVCAWLLLQCLPGSGSPRWTSSCVYLTAATESAWLCMNLLCEPPLLCA